MKVKLLAVTVGLLLLLETPSSVVAQTITSSPDSNIFCNGSEVIFRCETRGSSSLTWRSNDIYIQDRIGFAAIDAINDPRNGSSSNIVATLIQNDRDSRVLVSTLRIIPFSVISSGFVRCIVANGSEHRINFTVIASPEEPQIVATFQLEHIQNMCVIASVLRSPTDPAEADATNYTVSVNRLSVPYRNADFISTDGMRHSTLVYELNCGAHRISISANNMCGQSPDNDEIILDTDQRFVLNVSLPEPGGGTSNIECSMMTVIVGLFMVLFKYLLDCA